MEYAQSIRASSPLLYEAKRSTTYQTYFQLVIRKILFELVRLFLLRQATAV